MELTHSFTVPTSVDDAWALFMDLERVGSCFPGATVTEVTDDGFSGTVKVKLGPIALVYSGSGSFVARDDLAHHAVIEAKGKDKRGNGTAGAKVTVTLTPEGSGARADVVTDLSITGKPAQFGRGVMQDVSDKLLQAFVACIEQQLGGPPAETQSEPGAEGAEVPAADGGSPSPAAVAAGTVGVTPADMPESVTPPRRVLADVEEDAALDLGSTVMPVLMQRYAGYAAAAVVGVVLGWLLGRGRGS